MIYNTKEKWVGIIGFPAYKISSLGNIKTRWRRGAFYNGFQCKDVWKDLPINPDAHGYPYVHLCDGINKPKTCKIHRLVAEHFLEERPEGAQLVRHLDGNKSNNSLLNLAWGTYVDNENDKIQHGTWNTRNGGAKITSEQVMKIRDKIIIGEKQKDLAIEYGITRPTVNRIANNKIWKNI